MVPLKAYFDGRDAVYMNAGISHRRSLNCSKAFLNGMGRALDIAGALQEAEKSGKESDYFGMKQDWKNVGISIWRGIERHESTGG